MKFIDEAKIEIRAGHGGRGCISFRREKFIPRGGPDGGPGGKGGDIVFIADSSFSTLLDFRYKKVIEAQAGQNGMGSQCDGRGAEDVVVPIPIGTVVYDEEDNVTCDFVKEGQREILAKGGRGGRGNMFFVTSTQQAPQFAQDGEEGEVKTIRLELKLLADVGLIGLPNAGKSTFISSVTEARPKIADYPFTTLSPCLGVAVYKDAKPFVIADLPGLIEGAHEGKGMGDKFLKHSERTHVILHLVSLSPDEQTPPLDRYRLIEKEIKSYYKGKKPKQEKIVLLTKTDLVSKEEIDDVVSEFSKKDILVIPVSCVAHTNIDTVLIEVGKRLNTSSNG